MNSFVIVLMIVAGLALLALGGLEFSRQRARLARALRAEGVVTELIQVRSRDAVVVPGSGTGPRIEARRRYRPRVRFTTAAGRTVDIVGRVSTRPARWQVGERVRVVYLPNEADQAQIDSFLDLWFQPLMLAGFGLFTLGMGLVGLLASRI